jgi:hypothetical protein
MQQPEPGFSELTRNGSAVFEVPFMKLLAVHPEKTRAGRLHAIANLFSYRSFYAWSRPLLETFSKAASSK